MPTRAFVAALSLLGFASAQAAEMTFPLSLSGDQEVPGPGDPDGFGTGSITINDVTGLISWDIFFQNIDAPTMMHIHGPNGSPGEQAGVFVGLGVETDVATPNNLVFSTTTSPANAAAILANPIDYYVNIHNEPFGGGAIRGQVPEPATAALLALAGVTLLARRRRA